MNQAKIADTETMNRPFGPMGLLVLLALAPAGSVAQENPAVAPAAGAGVKTGADYVAPDYIRGRPILPEAMRGGQVMNMSLAQTVEMALRRNLALNLQREQSVASVEGRALAAATFEPTVQAQVGRSASESPPLTIQEGQAGQVLRNIRDVWNLTLGERLPTGTDMRLNFSSSRSDSKLGTAVEPRFFRSAVTLDLVQPLLRDFSLDGRIQRSSILRAEFGSELAMEEARLRAMLTVKATEDAYWNLVETFKTYEVNRGAQDLAGEQIELTKRQIAAGILPESDLIGVEGALAQRQLALLRAEVQIERAADQLRILLNLPEGDWKRPLVPVDSPSFLAVGISFEAAMQRAMAGRPEFKRVQIDLRRIALDLDVARNSGLPRLDLQGNLGSVGQDDSYNSTLSQVGLGSGPQWGVGVNFSWAPLAGAARAETRRLQSALRQSQLSREQAELDIRAQVREAIRNIETASRQVYASANFRDLAGRSLDIEQRRFLNGLSSNYVVSQRQADLAQARLSEIAALLQHERAASDLQLAMGDILEARRLVFTAKPAAR